MFDIKGTTQLFKVACMQQNKISFYKTAIEAINEITSKAEGDKLKLFVLELNTLSAYIEYELLQSDYNILAKMYNMNNKEMYTLRNELGLTYTMNIKENDCLIEVVDISKISMLKTEDLYDIFGLKEQKIESVLDSNTEYKTVNRKLLLDIKIIDSYLKANGYTGEITGTSSSFKELKKSYKGSFTKDFPRIDTELSNLLKPAYKGGVVLAPDYFINKKVRAISFDINSSYIHSMEKALPKGLPIVGEGKYEGDKLFIQQFKAKFHLKERGIPFLQNKFFEKVHDEIDLYGENLLLSKPDMELFFDNYTVEEIEYMTYYEFDFVINPFKEFIDKYYNMKLQSKKKGDKIGEARAKVRLNSCYGKFASKTVYKNTIPSYSIDEEGIKYRQVSNQAKAQYLPVAIFISAYSRYALINTINKLIDNEINLIYSDTDSIYVEESEYNESKMLEILDISDYELGYWKRQEDGTIKTFGNKTYVFQGDETGTVELVASGLSVDEEFESFEDVYIGKNIKCIEKRKVTGGFASFTVYKRIGKIPIEEMREIFGQEYGEGKEIKSEIYGGIDSYEPKRTVKSIKNM